MSNPTYKTIADIVAEKRARANEIEGAAGRDANQFQRELIADLRAEADELEAAVKRERERVEAEALTVGGMVEAARKPAGNAAALREALSDACYAMFNFLKTQNGDYEEMANALDKAKAALAEKHEAEWELGAEYEYAYCSHCGHMQWASWDSHREAEENIGGFNKEYKFCPNCGFEMKGANDEQ